MPPQASSLDHNSLEREGADTPIRVAIVTNTMSPYRIPLFEAMNQLGPRIKVFLMSDQDEHPHWRLEKISFPCQLMQGWQWRLPGAEAAIHFNVGMGEALARFAPDVVLGTGFTFANFQAARYCQRTQTPYIAWSDVSLRGRSSRSLVRLLIRRYIIHRAAGSIAASTDSERAFLAYGARRNDTLVSIAPVDVDHFHERTMLRRQDPDRALKRRFDGPVLLSMSPLIRRSGFAEMLRIFEQVQLTVPSASLVVLGEGPQRPELEAIVARRNIRNVYLEGFIRASKVPGYLAIADVFVFPTRFDNFGTSLAEAMAAECVVVASTHACATADLVSDGESGFMFDPKHVDAAANVVLQALALGPQQRAAMGRAAYESVAPYTFRNAARDIVAFIQARVRGKVSR